MKLISRILIMIILLSCSKEEADLAVEQPSLPSFSSKPITAAFVDSPYTYSVEAAGSGDLTFSLSSSPQNMTISSTGLLEWIPSDSSEFTNLVVIVATDSIGSNLQKFRLRVAGLVIEDIQTSTIIDEGLFGLGVENAIDDLHGNPIHSLHSFLVIKNNKLIIEEYFRGYTNSWPDAPRQLVEFNRSKPHFQASVTKSLISILTGIALEKGLIKSLDDTVFSYFPEYESYRNWDDNKAGITIRHLLTMSSGLNYGSPDWQSFVNKISTKDDWVKSILDQPVVTPPGKNWNYFSGGPHVLGALVANASGIALDDFAEQYLFSPLDIKGVEWSYSPINRAFGGGTHKMRPIDMAKLGYLFLNNGRWKDIQILSEAWIKESTTAFFTPHDGYGYLWWKTTFDQNITANLAAGGGGQEIYIFPDLDLAIAITAGYYESGSGHDYIRSFIQKNIL